MNNEIKEILENIKCPQLGYDEYGKWGALPLNVRMTLKRLCDYVVSCDDYITNLQQRCVDIGEYNTLVNKYNDIWKENKILKEANVYCNRTDCVGRIKDSRKYDGVYQEKEDYKSRCEKAVEYIKEMLYPIGSCVNGSDLPYESIESLLNILQNGSDTSE